MTVLIIQTIFQHSTSTVDDIYENHYLFIDHNIHVY